MAEFEALLPLTLGDRSVTVDARRVVEILGAVEWVALPGARRALPGALAWRGRALALLDLGPPLGFAPLRPPQTRARTLIIEADDDVVALSVDRALEVRPRTSELAPLIAGLAGELPCVGVWIVGEQPTPVLDLDAWVRALRGGG